MQLHQKAAHWVCAILIVFTLTACGKIGDETVQQPGKIEYTNLYDTGSRQFLQSLIFDAGVSEVRIRNFFSRVDAFNDSVQEAWLTHGFEEAEPLYTKYEPYEMHEEWVSKNGAFPGWNCRMTALGLFGDLVSAGDEPMMEVSEDVLFVDEEALNTDIDALGGSSLTDFRTLYASIRAEDTTDISRHVQTVQEAWRTRSVTFDENEKIRLITVFFHDKPTEEVSLLFVGHAGVLLTADDGALYFIEKVAFHEPYRLLRFSDRTALSEYLMRKYDISWGQDTASPFIMENDELMAGYSPNP